MFHIVSILRRQPCEWLTDTTLYDNMTEIWYQWSLHKQGVLFIPTMGSIFSTYWLLKLTYVTPHILNSVLSIFYSLYVYLVLLILNYIWTKLSSIFCEENLSINNKIILL